MKRFTMNDETTPPHGVAGAAAGCDAAGRVIATVGAARILRHQDGSLDVHGPTANERDAALAWLFAVSPGLLHRVRPCRHAVA